MELLRQKNVTTYIVFPITDINGDIVTGAANLDSEFTFWENNSAPGAFNDLTAEAVEIGATGNYYLALSADEMNHTYIMIQVKTSTADAKTQFILIRTMTGDPKDIATTPITITTNNDKTGYSLSAAGIDSIHDEIIDGAWTFRKLFKILCSFAFGLSTDGGTKFRDLANSKNRIIATLDVNKNRTSMTLDGD